MAKTIQIRNVPEAIHRRLRQRAADAGMSLSEHLLAELTRIATLPTRKEWLERLHAGARVKLGKSAAALVRRERDSA
jgi:plasmid stability protein